MPRTKLVIPKRGVADNTEHFATPSDVCAPESMLNVLPAEGLRQRFTKRRGIQRLFDGALALGPVQGGISVNRASQTGNFILGNRTDIVGSSSARSAILGNAWLLDSAPSMARMHYFDVTSDGGPASVAVNAIAFTQDKTGLIVSTNYTSGGFTKSRVRRIRVSDGVTLWTADIAQAVTNRYVTTLCCSREYVLVCTNQYVRALNLSTGAQVGSEWNLAGWSFQAVQAGTHYNSTTGVEHMFVGFNGSVAVGTRTGGGAIDAGVYAEHFRSGVIKAKLIPLSLVGAGAWYSQVSYGTQLGATSLMYEAPHGYYRFSEQSRNAPHGCVVQALAMDSAGGVYVARSSAGWGPTSSYKPTPTSTDPDGSVGRPFVTVTKINEDGPTIYESDAAEPDQGFPTIGDYAFTDALNPTFWAGCVDWAGHFYVGGRTNQSLASVYAIDPYGEMLWRANLTGGYPGTTQIARGAMAIDPADNNVLCAGYRNTGWDGAGGQQAHIWKLSRNDGSVIWAYDIGKAVSGLCIAASGSYIAYGSDYAS